MINEIGCVAWRNLASIEWKKYSMLMMSINKRVVSDVNLYVSEVVLSKATLQRPWYYR